MSVIGILRQLDGGAVRHANPVYSILKADVACQTHPYRAMLWPAQFDWSRMFSHRKGGGDIRDHFVFSNALLGPCGDLSRGLLDFGMGSVSVMEILQ